MPSSVAILFDKLGPYHAARIVAAARLYPTVAVEFARDSARYAWTPLSDEGQFERVTLVPEGKASDLSKAEFARRLFSTLEKIRPRVIALPGWSHRGALLALLWALRTGTPTVVMSASQEIDHPRRWWKEKIKATILKLCSAALVAGERHAAYVRSLGMPADCVFLGYDAVDNDYFAAHAERIRAKSDYHRQQRGLPAHFFVASGRFVPPKNILGLLRGYAKYREQAAASAFKLVILGDGPMWNDVLQLRTTLGLQSDVLLCGFRQYEELPVFFALAEALVHASTVEPWGLVVNEAAAAGLPLLVSRRCGCAPELVVEGENGFTFDPEDEDALARGMSQIASAGTDRAEMGRRSRELVARFSPHLFGKQLGRACEVALNRPRASLSLDRRVLLEALASR